MRDDMTIQQAQDAVDRWISSTDAGYFSPLTNAVILAEETGEVARVMARAFGDQRPKAGDPGRGQLADELADLMWVIMAIANQTGIDLTVAFAENIRKKTLRDSARFNCGDAVSHNKS